MARVPVVETQSTMQLLGQMISMGIATTRLSTFIGIEQIFPELMDELIMSVNVAFAIITFNFLISIFAALARRKLRDGKSCR